jgi:hypothetical protein
MKKKVLLCNADKIKALVRNLSSQSTPEEQKPATLAPPVMERSISQVQSDEQVIQIALSLAQARRKSFAVERSGSGSSKSEVPPNRRTMVRDTNSTSPVTNGNDGSPRKSLIATRTSVQADDKLLKTSNSSDIKRSNSTTSTDPHGSERSIKATNPTSEKPQAHHERSILQNSAVLAHSDSQGSSQPEPSVASSLPVSDSRVSRPKIQMQIELPKPPTVQQLQQSHNQSRGILLQAGESTPNPNSVVVNIPTSPINHSATTSNAPTPPAAAAASSPGPAPVPLNKGFGHKSSQNIVPVRGWRSIFHNKMFRQPDYSNTTGVSLSMLKLSGDKDEALFHPHALMVKVWNSVYFAFQLVIVTCIPICIAFEDTFGSLIYGFSIANSIGILLDTFIKYNTGIMVNQQVQMEDIALHYFKNGSWIFDIVTFIPWVYVIDAATQPLTIGRTTARMICMVNSSVIISILFVQDRKSYLSEKLRNWARKNGVSSALLDSVQVMILMCFYWHFNACFTMILRKIRVSFTVQVFNNEWEHYSAAIFDAAAEMLANG